jgi:hypothetical protein
VPLVKVEAADADAADRISQSWDWLVLLHKARHGHPLLAQIVHLLQVVKAGLPKRK